MPRYDEEEDHDGGRPAEPEPGTCPSCGSRRSKKISFTWWGGAVGPAIFSLVKCAECSQQYNRKSGKPFGWLPIIIYSIVVSVIFGAIFIALMR